MDDILAAPRPKEPDQWLKDTTSQKAFYHAIADFLIDQLAYQVDGITREQAAALIRPRPPERLANNQGANGHTQSAELNITVGPAPVDLYELDVALARGDKTLIIRDIHFPANDPRLGFDYVSLLALIPSLHLLNCHFYSESLSLGYAPTHSRFEDCTFHLSWQVEEGNGPGRDHVLFDHCRFEQGIAIQGNELGQPPIDSALAFFRDCVIPTGLSLREMATEIPIFADTLVHKPEITRISVANCEFAGRFALANAEAIEKIKLTSTVFKDKFALIHCPLNELLIKNVNFEGLADFYESSFNSLLIRKSIFRDFVGFEDCRFGTPGQQNGRIVLRYVTFYSFTNFRGAQFLLPLDLRNTNRSEQPNFLDAHFAKNARQHTDRETFRIIKQSFEAVGNRIEANVFYALEMEAYRRELREAARQHGWHWRCWERLLISLNFLLSRHGQSYWQPLVGIALCSAVLALQQANWRHGWVVWPETIRCYLTPLLDVLNGWAKGVVIFRPLYAGYPGHEALILLMAIALSTCTWHFLVAARRHRRR